MTILPMPDWPIVSVVIEQIVLRASNYMKNPEVLYQLGDATDVTAVSAVQQMDEFILLRYHLNGNSLNCNVTIATYLCRYLTFRLDEKIHHWQRF